MAADSVQKRRIQQRLAEVKQQYIENQDLLLLDASLFHDQPQCPRSQNAIRKLSFEHHTALWNAEGSPLMQSLRVDEVVELCEGYVVLSNNSSQTFSWLGSHGWWSDTSALFESLSEIFMD